jgi:signal recognition particle receptor subunit beta
VASYVYEIFVKKEEDQEIPMLVVANKQDMPNALDKLAIEEKLVEMM